MLCHTTYGTVALTAAGSQESETSNSQAGLLSVAPVSFPSRGSSVLITAEVTLAEKYREGGRIFVVYGGVAQPVLSGGFYSLEVPVGWDGDTPHTRVAGKDNFDVILMTPKGLLVDLQCSLVTRANGRFFLQIQRVWEGTPTRTRGEGNAIVRKFKPSHSLLCYPGMDYEKVWGPMAAAVLAEAVEIGATQQNSRAASVEWHPPVISARPVDGWREGVVLFFNACTGSGRIAAKRMVGNQEEEEIIFVHFRAIQNGGDVPVITPRTKVLFKDAPGQKPGQSRRATVVKYANGSTK